MSFAVGQRVMCIHRWRGRGSFNLPQFMNVYTVRAYCPCAAGPSILLEEIHNRQVLFATTYLRGEASFAEFCFRALEPLTETRELETVA